MNDGIEQRLPPDLLRRRLVSSLVYGAAAATWFGLERADAQAAAVEVWTGPSCGCCRDWIDHLVANGFSVTSHDGGNSEARERLGIPVRFGSCHSAAVEGYGIEGHVPARDIYRLLAERPNAVGLSVPAMPRGAPGMDGPAYGNVRDPYDVLLIGREGDATVVQSYP